MSELIFYHYGLSPFSEKIRLMLGYTGQSWRSVKVMPMPPRPELEILTAGYRKIPVMQVGAHVFCDTKSIARLIAARTGKPELAIENCSEAAQAFAHRTDLEVFLAIVAVAGPGLLKAVYRETSLLGTLRFVKDRLGVLKKAAIKPASGARARQMTDEQVAGMEKLLTQDFLFGSSPCAADFSAYHGLWFLVDKAGKDVLGDAPAVRSWMQRMRAFGHGQPSELSMEEALDIAQQDEPAAAQPATTGQRVRVAPADYARDPIVGELVSEDSHGCVVAHSHARVGTIHLHLPKTGYEIERLS